jgi:hypothetical protein
MDVDSDSSSGRSDSEIGNTGITLTAAEQRKLDALLRHVDEVKREELAIREKPLEEQEDYWLNCVDRALLKKTRAEYEQSVVKLRQSAGTTLDADVLEQVRSNTSAANHEWERADAALRDIRGRIVKNQAIRLQIDKLPSSCMGTRYEFLKAMTVLRKSFLEMSVPDSHKIIVARSFVEKNGKRSLNATTVAGIETESKLKTADEVIAYYVSRYKGDTTNCFIDEQVDICQKAREHNNSKVTLVSRLEELRAHCRAWEPTLGDYITEASFKGTLVKICGGWEALRNRWVNDQRTIESFTWETLFEVCKDHAEGLRTSNSTDRGNKRRAETRVADDNSNTDVNKALGDTKKERRTGSANCKGCGKRPFHRHHRVDCTEIANDAEAIAAAKIFFTEQGLKRNL